MSQKVESHKTKCVAFKNFSEDSYYKEKSSREKNKKNKSKHNLTIAETNG